MLWLYSIVKDQRRIAPWRSRTRLGLPVRPGGCYVNHNPPHPNEPVVPIYSENVRDTGFYPHPACDERRTGVPVVRGRLYGLGPVSIRV